MRRSTIAAVTAAILLLVALRVGVAPPERCPTVTRAEARRSVDQAVGWLGRTQHLDGRFRYLGRPDGSELDGYSAVRHAGVLLSLEQAANAGSASAEDVADAGWAWARRHIQPVGPGRALVEEGGQVETGATALLVRALVERGDVDPDLLQDLGAFLAGQVRSDGSVASSYDRTAGEPTDTRDPFYTGQTYWALLAVPDQPAATARVGRYLPHRDEHEEWMLPLVPHSDHWAAYAYGDLGADGVTSEQQAHGDRLAWIFGTQVRGESTRWQPGLQRWLRRGPAVASGVASLAEGGAGILRLDGDDAPSGLPQRVRCAAGMLVARQAADGAWYTHGVTRMDDEQHAISALVAAAPLLDGGDTVGGGEEPWGVPLLAVAGLLFANPFLPVERRRRSVLIAGGVGVALVGLSCPLLDVLSTSPSNARMAAGAGAAVVAIGWLVSPRSAISRGLAAAGGAVAAVSAGADSGMVALVAVGVGAGSVLLAPPGWRRPWAARAAAVALLLVGLDLVARGAIAV